MTQKQLEKKVRYWQKILKLDHWDIHAEFVNALELNGSGADINVQAEYLKANVRVLKPEFYNTGSNRPTEERFETNIIHELLHCHTDPLTKGSSKHHLDHEERCVTTLAKAIYDLWPEKNNATTH